MDVLVRTTNGELTLSRDSGRLPRHRSWLSIPLRALIPMDRELEMLLRLGVRALSKLPGGLLQGGERHFVSLSEKAQVRVAAERSMMAEFA